MTFSYRKLWMSIVPVFLCTFGIMAWMVSYPSAQETNGTSFDAFNPSNKFIIPVKTFRNDATYLYNFTTQWYSQNFIAIKEKQITHYPAQEALFRLTIIPTFTPAHTFRLTQKNDKYTLIFKAADGAGGYDPGQLEIHDEIPLDQTVASSLIATFEKLDICNLPKDDANGADGSVWVFETNKIDNNGDRHVCFSEYWAPDVGYDEMRKSMTSFRKSLAAEVTNYMTEDEYFQRMLENANEEN